MLQGFAQHLVVIATECVARYVGELCSLENRPGGSCLVGPIIHACADHAQGAGHIFRRARATCAMTGHVMHRTVSAGLEPSRKMRLVFAQFDIGDADGCETEFGCPARELDTQLRELLRRHDSSSRGGHRGGRRGHRGSITSGYTSTMSLPIALYGSAEVRAIDARAIALQGIAGYALMERAAAAALRSLRARFAVARELCVLAGPGNNGGDGYVLARLARRQGFAVRVIAVGKAPGSADAARAARDCAAAGVAILPLEQVDLPRELQAADVLVDALLGIGIKEIVREPFHSVIVEINAAQRPVLALDIPSGLCADTGRVQGVAVRADVTVTFVAAKVGLWIEEGPQQAGEIFFDDLGVEPPTERPQLERLHPAALALALPPRPREAHKGDFGHVMVLGGGPGMPGAARLAAEAALRVGAGRVTVLCHPESVDAVAAGRAELMVRGIESVEELREMLAHCDLLAVGPGLGRSEWARALWAGALDAVLPKVIDADALNLLAEHRSSGREQVERAASHWILTPHPGEAGRLLGIDSAAVQADRMAALRRLQSEYGGICILKGAGTLIGRADAPPAICDRGNPAMAAPGMGDVLTGMLAGLWVQSEDESLAAAAAVWWHAAAGDEAASTGPAGGGALLAGDVLAALPAVLARVLDVVRRGGAVE